MKKGLFSKIIVVFCITEITFMMVWAMRIASHTGLELKGLMTVNAGVFAGELLLLCLKRIFAKDKESGEDK